MNNQLHRLKTSELLLTPSIESRQQTFLRKYRSAYWSNFHHVFVLMELMLYILMLYVAPAQSCTDISIEQPFDPFYVKNGGNITIKCLCMTGQHKLEWVQQTTATAYRDSLIVPTKENSFVVQTLTEEPTGRTESTLIKYNMADDDRGSYVCRDSTQENSFAVWVTVITVIPKKVKVEADDEEFTLQCQLDLSSFNTNPATMNYTWQREDHRMLLTHLDAEITFDEKYEARRDYWSSISLIVSNPTRADMGLYTCSFIIPTNIGPIEISETFRVEGSSQLPAGAPALSFPPQSSGILTIQIILATVVQLVTVYLLS